MAKRSLNTYVTREVVGSLSLVMFNRTMEMWQWGTLSVGIVRWVGVGLGGLRHFFQPE